MKLEEHFNKKCRVHNEDKKQRADLLKLKNFFQDDENKYPTFFNEMPNSVKASEEGLPANSSGPKTNDEVGSLFFNLLSLNAKELYVEQSISLAHGIRKYRVRKARTDHVYPDEKEIHSELDTTNSDIKSNCAPTSTIRERETDAKKRKDLTLSMDKQFNLPQDNNAFDLAELQAVLESLIHFDVEYMHIYSEGAEMTVADLIILPCLYYLLVSWLIF